MSTKINGEGKIHMRCATLASQNVTIETQCQKMAQLIIETFRDTVSKGSKGIPPRVYCPKIATQCDVIVILGFLITRVSESTERTKALEL